VFVFAESQVQARGEAVRIATGEYVAGRGDVLWVSDLQSGQLASEADLNKLQAPSTSTAARSVVHRSERGE
jgi:hypothetical protein